jgi:ADP-heptose:LPS heptosyltransferase
MNPSPRILVIRRDNLGDLICTTPLLHALRSRFPSGYIAVLASSYNAAILDGNPDVDEVFMYLKRQHKSHGHGSIGTLLHRWQTERALRAKRFDYVLLANGGWRYARKLGGRTLVGFLERDNPDHRQPDVIVPLENRGQNHHEVEKMALLGAAIGVTEALGPLRLYPDDARKSRVAETLIHAGWRQDRPTLAVHISSRQPVQRWPAENFAEFARQTIERYGVQILLLWAPGAPDDPMHPGDDDKAERLLERLQGLPIYPCPTTCVENLIAAIALVDQMVCSDGGAMHVAAALDKPLLCFFGHSNVVEWRPWKVPHVLLQPPSRVVADIEVAEAVEGFRRLQIELREQGRDGWR